MLENPMEWEQPGDAPEDAEQTLADVKALLERDDWEEKYREPLFRSYAPEEPEQAKSPVVYGDVEVPKPDQKNTILIAIIVVETLLLLTGAGWWLLWR